MNQIKYIISIRNLIIPKQNIKYNNRKEKLTINDLWWINDKLLNTDEHIEYNEKDISDIEEIYNLATMNQTKLEQYKKSNIDNRDLSIAEIKLHQKQVDEKGKTDISHVTELDPFILSKIGTYLNPQSVNKSDYIYNNNI